LSNDQPGRLDGARRDAQESLDIFTRLGDSWGMGEALAGQAENAGFSGDYELAVSVSRKAIELARMTGATHEFPMLQVRLGESLLGTGAEEEGESAIREGIAAARAGGPRDQGAAFFGTFMLAAQRGRQGRLAECRELLEPIRSGMNAFGIGSLLGGMVDGMIGWIEAKEGRPEEGLVTLRGGLERLTDHELAPFFGVPLMLAAIPSAAFVLLECARKGTARGPAERAAALIGAYGTLRTGHAQHRLESVVLDEAVAGLREFLGDQAYDAAHERGVGLDADSLLPLMHGI